MGRGGVGGGHWGSGKNDFESGSGFTPAILPTPTVAIWAQRCSNFSNALNSETKPVSAIILRL